ncbi:MAG: hypothetical protein V8T39_07535 [Streptococcus lutetiensis]
MNLTERAEIRKETFYKLTNSRNVPVAPSVGGRNYLHGTSTAYQSYTGTNYILGYPSTYRDWTKLLDPLRGKTVTIKAYIKNDTDYPVRIQMWFTGGGVYGNAIPAHSEGWSVKTGIMSTNWTSANVAFTQEGQNATGGTIQAKEVKVEVSESATPYSKAPEDLGWSTDTLVPTQSNRYLWKFEYIYYSDGSVENTQPVNISIAGADGTNGQTSHVHFAFADNATGGGFSLTTPKAYMGWYADFNEAASTDPTKYRWSKWKGDQGLPGKPGADGKTSYFHMAYADSADGRTGFSFKESGQQYQGYYTDFTQTSSTDPTKYTWVDRLANVKGGSRNYFKNSLTKTFYTTDAQTFDWRTYIVDAFWKNKDRLKKNFVKISFDITFPVALENDYTANIHFSATPWYSNRVTFKAGTTSRQHFEFGIDLSSASEDYHTDNVFIRFGTEYGFPSGFKIILENMMLSIGSYYPDYIQAIEDTQEQIDSKADQALTQEQLNALEAKRLQMETEMKALATLQQVSELETFINNLKKEDLDGRQKIIEITKAIEERVKDIEPIMEYSQKLKFMDTYITQGNGGMIIGANDSTTKVVVTPDRISFQSGGSEVAYISQRMLHIDNGVFTMSLQLGHYITRAHPKNEYVNATYFVK